MEKLNLEYICTAPEKLSDDFVGLKRCLDRFICKKIIYSGGEVSEVAEIKYSVYGSFGQYLAGVEEIYDERFKERCKFRANGEKPSDLDMIAVIIFNDGYSFNERKTTSLQKSEKIHNKGVKIFVGGIERESDLTRMAKNKHVIPDNDYLINHFFRKATDSLREDGIKYVGERYVLNKYLSMFMRGSCIFDKNSMFAIRPKEAKLFEDAGRVGVYNKLEIRSFLTTATDEKH